MMEGTHTDFGRVGGTGARELRTPQWAELVARFDAARELRAGFRASLPRDAGSFSRLVERSGESVKESAATVNHADLADGKTVPAETADQVSPDQGTGLTGDREL